MSVKVLANHRISPEIIDLIEAARKHVDLVTPYVQPWGHLNREIEAACNRGVKVRLFFREELRSKYKDTLTEFMHMGVEIYAIDHLHAKVYRSESMAIVSSMNLYNYSTENSQEIALVSTDRETLKEIAAYIDKLEVDARNITLSLLGAKAASKIGGAFKSMVGKVGKAIASSHKDEPAHCIRCGTEVGYNPDRPLCPKCYKSWNQYGDPDYKEKFCHSCGKNGKTSVARPECLQCFKENAG
ncbi:hypothetical protein KDL29_08920 [bacterium]|nr:hypothetical protein [bacterium]